MIHCTVQKSALVFELCCVLCVPQVEMPRVKGFSSRPKKKKAEWLAEPTVEEPEATEKTRGDEDEGHSPTGIML